MDFLILSRATATAATVDDDVLNERHWAYMDPYADALTARGPTFDRERDAWTGSMHIVDLPGPDAAREFVANEPYNSAGLFETHRIWRFDNLLGRTMWGFDGPDDEQRFFVVAGGPGDAELPPDRLIVLGRLHDLDDEPAGLALAVQAPNRAALDEVVAGLGEVEVHDWEFGGRR
jgi:uncharacterized protein